MVLVYIIAPYRDNGCTDEEENVDNASDLAREIVRASVDDRGYPHAFPVCTHSMTWMYSDASRSDEYWLEGTAEILTRCDAAVVADDWENSIGGCQAEIDLAEVELGIPVLYGIEEFRKWMRTR